MTINESDFWRKIAITDQFCVVCFALSDSRAREIPQRLRILFENPLFDTKQKRMGKIVRVAEKEVSYYSVEDRTIR